MLGDDGLVQITVGEEGIFHRLPSRGEVRMQPRDIEDTGRLPAVIEPLEAANEIVV